MCANWIKTGKGTEGDEFYNEDDEPTNDDDDEIVNADLVALRSPPTTATTNTDIAAIAAAIVPEEEEEEYDDDDDDVPLSHVRTTRAAQAQVQTIDPLILRAKICANARNCCSEGQKATATKMFKMNKKKISSFKIGDLVMVSVPDVEMVPLIQTICCTSFWR